MNTNFDVSIKELLKTKRDEIIFHKSNINTDDWGIYDYVENIVESFENGNEATKSIEKDTLKITDDIEKLTGELNACKAVNNNVEIINVFKKNAKALDCYSSSLKSKTKLVATNYIQALEYTISLIQEAEKLEPDFNDKDTVIATQEQFNDFKSVLPSAKSGMIDFKNALAEWPNLHSSINKSKKKLINELDNFVVVIDTMIEIVTVVDKEMTKLINKL